MTCSCGCNVVEDDGSESYCTSCGSLVSSAPLVTSWRSGQNSSNLWDVSDTFRQRGLKMSCYTPQGGQNRVKRMRLANIVTECRKLNLVNIDLVSETVYSILLESNLVTRKKHLLKKHIAGGIYTACKILEIEMTCSKIIEDLGLLNNSARFIKRFYHDVNKKDNIPLDFRKLYELVDFKDLESNTIIPQGKAAIYHKHYNDLVDIMFASKLKLQLEKSRRRGAAVLIDMILKFDTEMCISLKNLAHFDIRSDNQIDEFKRVNSKCWSLLTVAAVKNLPWILPNLGNIAHVYPVKPPSRAFMSMRLDKILANKKILIEYFYKSQENFNVSEKSSFDFLKTQCPSGDLDGSSCNIIAPEKSWNCNLGTNVPLVQSECNDIEISAGGSEVSSESSFLKSNAESTVNESVAEEKLSDGGTNSLSTNSSILNRAIMDDCINNLRQYISDHRYKFTTTIFERMCNILYFTDLRSKFINIPRLVYFILLHQIITAHETNVPPLQDLFKDSQKAIKVDGLIRLNFIKLCMTFPIIHGQLPTKIAPDKLSETVHLYYNIILANLKIYTIIMDHLQSVWDASQNYLRDIDDGENGHGENDHSENDHGENEHSENSDSENDNNETDDGKSHDGYADEDQSTMFDPSDTVHDMSDATLSLARHVTRINPTFDISSCRPAGETHTSNGNYYDYEDQFTISPSVLGTLSSCDSTQSAFLQNNAETFSTEAIYPYRNTDNNMTLENSDKFMFNGYCSEPLINNINSSSPHIAPSDDLACAAHSVHEFCSKIHTSVSEMGSHWTIGSDNNRAPLPDIYTPQFWTICNDDSKHHFRWTRYDWTKRR